MAENVYKSPGVFTREIDISQPTAQGIAGIPAGVIGTSDLGPAFVPKTFGNISSFVEQFGDIDGSSYGKIAAQEYLTRGGSAITYVRVLGIGDGKQRNSNGSVTNAGFNVGNKLVQAAGDLGNNIYANAGSGDINGRTYFLGCFMSESAGSTIFSSAGIQKTDVIAEARIYIQDMTTGSILLTDVKGLSKMYHFHTGTNAAAISAAGAAAS